jgi:hypothetical protein
MIFCPICTDSGYVDYRLGTFLSDEFATGGDSSGTIGSLGWFSAGTITTPSATTRNPGQRQIDTSAVSSTQARITALGSSIGVFDPAVFTRLVWVVKLNHNDTDTAVRLGMGNNTSSNPPVNGIYFEKLLADTNWFLVTRAASSQTRQDSGVAATTADFVTFSVVRDTLGVSFFINSVLVSIPITSTIPTTYLNPMAWIINGAAASKTLLVDYFEIRQTGLERD